jgi:hypothetical protein
MPSSQAKLKQLDDQVTLCCRSCHGQVSGSDPHCGDMLNNSTVINAHERLAAVEKRVARSLVCMIVLFASRQMADLSDLQFR